MVVIAVVRISGHHINGSLDTTSSLFKVYIEALVATIMASITDFWTPFVQGSAGVPDKQKNIKGFHFPKELLQWKICRSGWEEIDQERWPKVASDTNTSIKTFIYQKDHSTAKAIPMQSRLIHGTMATSTMMKQDAIKLIRSILALAQPLFLNFSKSRIHKMIPYLLDYSSITNLGRGAH